MFAVLFCRAALHSHAAILAPKEVLIILRIVGTLSLIQIGMYDRYV